jgi:hypothetical protein
MVVFRLVDSKDYSISFPKAYLVKTVGFHRTAVPQVAVAKRGDQGIKETRHQLKLCLELSCPVPFLFGHPVIV